MVQKVCQNVGMERGTKRNPERELPPDVGRRVGYKRYANSEQGVRYKWYANETGFLCDLAS